jgi:putative transposase
MTFPRLILIVLTFVAVERGRFHNGKDLVVPENIVLLFQPPYCPELNPIERLWEHIKADLKWDSFKTLTQLQTKVDRLLKDLTPEVIASITGYSFILDALSALNTIFRRKSKVKGYSGFNCRGGMLML